MRLDEDYEKREVSSFMGLFDRASEDSVPPDHAVKCQNVLFQPGNVRTRSGIHKAFTVGYGGVVLRWFQSCLGIIYLDDAGKFYLNAAAAPFLTVAGATDFSAFNVYDRVYITPHNGATGLSGAKVYVLLLVATVPTCYLAAGLPLARATAMTAVESATLGNISLGTHKFVVFGETITGHWVPLGPYVPNTSGAFTPTSVNIVGTKATVNLTTDNTLPTAGSVVRIGAIPTFYTFKSTLTDPPIPYEVLLQTDGDVSLDSLVAAINRASGYEGTLYSAGTEANPDVTCGARAGHVVVLTAIEAGPDGNDILTDCSTGTHLTFGHDHLQGGQFNKVTLANIPNTADLPANITKRLFAATKADEEEYFLIAGAELTNPATSTLVVDFSDEELVESVDYLQDQLWLVPSAVGLTMYKNRMTTWGEYPPDHSIVRFSATDDIESFDAVDGVQIVNKEDGDSMQCALVLRGILYLFKNSRTFGLQDNGEVPSDWGTPFVVDEAKGTHLRGVSQVSADATSQVVGDRVLVATKAGIYSFSGVYGDFPLTWKISAVWDRINWSAFHKMNLIEDHVHKMAFISLPLDGASDVSHLLAADYAEAESGDYMKIKWQYWTFPIAPNFIRMAYLSDGLYAFRFSISSGDGIYAWEYGSTRIADLTTYGIESYYELSQTEVKPGQVHIFVGARFHITGNGTLALNARGIEGTPDVNILPLTIVPGPSKDSTRRFNYQGEKLYLKFGVTTLNHYFNLSRVDVFGKPLWPMRPNQ